MHNCTTSCTRINKTWLFCVEILLAFANLRNVLKTSSSKIWRSWVLNNAHTNVSPIPVLENALLLENVNWNSEHHIGLFTVTAIGNVLLSRNSHRKKTRNACVQRTAWSPRGILIVHIPTWKKAYLILYLWSWDSPF